MKNLSICLAVLVALSSSFSVSSFAHDGGHGPKVVDAGKQGGVVAPVIDVKEVKRGDHAQMVYKAELVRSEGGNVRVYFYDKDMNALDLKKLDPKASAVVEVIKKKKVTKTPFSLKLEDGAFVGTAPKPLSKPFNIGVTIKEGSRELVTEFSNLD